MARETNGWSPYRAAFLFSTTGRYVSRTCVTALARPCISETESTHEKKSNEEGERPHCKDMVGPPPAKVLESASGRLAYA